MQDKYPVIIYGTAWKEERTQELVSQALALGFRAIDSANQRKHYWEQASGTAVAEWVKKGNDRKQLFLQSKFTHLGGQDHRLPYNPQHSYRTQVLQSFESSLSHYNTDYLDSYLIHGPNSPFEITTEDIEIWQTMEELQKTGKIKSIGISNVNIRQLRQLYDLAEIKPASVQNRCYAARQWDSEIRKYCKDHGIHYQGFSLLTANPQLFSHPIINSISKKQNKTPAQVILAFAQKSGMTVLSGTTDPGHMQQDLQIETIQFSQNELETLETGC